jgi:hypothetical protein
MRRFIFSVVILMLLIGCAGVQRLNTPSGKPEVTLRVAEKKEVIDIFTNAFANKGFNPIDITEYKAVYGKRMEDNVAASVLMGSRYDSVPEYRITCTFVNLPSGDLRIITDLAIITNPGSAFERRTDMNRSKDSHAMQKELETLKSRYE